MSEQESLSVAFMQAQLNLIEALQGTQPLSPALERFKAEGGQTYLFAQHVCLEAEALGLLNEWEFQRLVDQLWIVDATSSNPDPHGPYYSEPIR